MANLNVNRASKALLARLTSCRVVLWALDVHAPRLMEVFNGPLGKTLPQELQAFFEQHVAQLREVLSAARDLLIANDRNLRDQRALTTRFRRIRDSAFDELNPYVMGIKDTFRGACGPEVAVELGFVLRIPEQPGELHEQAAHLVGRLSQPDLELPAVRYRGVNLDPSTVVEEMAPLVERLGQALEDLGREERKTDAMKIAKDEALGAYNRTFQWVAGSAEELFRLANLPEIASRVRPSSRRAGVTDEVETQGPDIQIEDPAPTAEEDMPEAPDGSARARPDIPPAELVDEPPSAA